MKTCSKTLSIAILLASGLIAPERILADLYTTTIDDTADLYGGRTPGLGFPTWRVSQPFTSLWIQYPVIRYTTATGKTFNLDIAFRQRGALTNGNAFSFGPSWQCSWLSTVAYSVDQEGGVWLAGGDPSTVNPPLGGNLAYSTDGVTPEYNTYSTLTFKAANGSGPCGFDAYINYPDGSIFTYDYKICPTCFGACTVTNYLTYATDPQGRITQLNYTTSNNVVLLTSVRDSDLHTNLFVYDSRFPTQVSYAVDPYLRTNSFHYDATGRLTNIVNAAGMSFSFVYDSQGMITNMITPYGTNIFQYASNTNTGNVVKRSMLVTEPDGRNHLFAYRDQSTYLNTNLTTALIPFSYPTNQVPNTVILTNIVGIVTNYDSTGTNIIGYTTNTVPVFTNTFDNTWMDARDSFYWSPHCYSQLSSSFLSSQNFNNLSTNDYLLADMKHWLLEDNSSGLLGNTLSMERGPSPDGTLEGQKSWLDYWGKKPLQTTNSGQAYTSFFSNGTNANPSIIAAVLPDGTTRFGYSEYNIWGRPTHVVSTYSTTTGVSLRTNTFLYAVNAIDLTGVLGVNNELLSSNIFNGSHMVITNFNAVGDKTAVIYNSINEPLTIIGPTGLTITNTYTSSGWYANFLQAVSVPATGATNSFTYTNGLVLTHTDERGLTTTNICDILLRPASVSGPNGTASFIYTNMRLKSVTDQMGFTGTSYYDSTGKKLYDVDPLNRTNRYAYYSWGGLLAVTNPLQQFVSWTYDNLGRTLVTTMPDSTCSTNSFNLIGQLTRAFDPAGNSVSWTYNNQGLVTVVTNAYGAIGISVFDNKDRVISTVDANSTTNSFTYDLLNRLLTHTAPDNGVESFAYSPFGLTAYTNQINQFLHYGYDVATRLTSETNANNEVIQYAYDVSGNLTNLIDGKAQATKWIYDQFSRVTTKIDAAGNTNFTFAYDPDHRLTNRWSAAKGNTTFSYDSVGNLTNVIHPVSPAVSLAYDALNRLTNMVDGIGTSKFQYTVFGAPLSEDGPWNDDTITYNYTVNHLLAGLSLQQPNASPWSQSMSYDLANRLQNITSPAGSFGYGYLLAGGVVKTIALPNGASITNVFDPCVRLADTLLKNSSNSTLDSDIYQYDAAGQLTNHVRFDGSHMAYTYDSIGQLKTASAYESGGAARLHEKLGFAYDAAHNLAFRTNNALVQTFNLNSLNQLTTISRTGTFTVAGTTTSAATNVTVNNLAASLYGDFTFAKDSFSLADGSNSFTAAAQDSYGRSDTNSISVTLPATVSFIYDLNGNLTSDGTRGFDYDDENQLIRITVTNAWKSEFAYDGLGRRRTRSEYTWQSGGWVRTNQVTYIYSGKFVVQERDANNAPRVAYTRGLDLSGSFDGAGGIGGLLARTDCGALIAGSTSAHAFYRSDGAGNITSLINSQQSLVARYLYDPFGNTLSKSGALADANLYRFSSKEIHSSSGLYHFGARFYDPSLQRWLNRDPLGEAGGINLYAFAGNASYNALDPWGYDLETNWSEGDEEEVGDFGTDPGNPTGTSEDTTKLGAGTEGQPRPGIVPPKPSPGSGSTTTIWDSLIKPIGTGIGTAVSWIGHFLGIGSSNSSNQTSGQSGGSSLGGPISSGGPGGSGGGSGQDTTGSPGFKVFPGAAHAYRAGLTQFKNFGGHSEQAAIQLEHGIADWTQGTVYAGLMTLEWGLGVGPLKRDFGADTVQTRQMMSDPEIQDAIQDYTTANMDIDDPRDYHAISKHRDFGLRGLIAAGINPTRQFVGGYDITISPTSTGAMNIKLHNITSFMSLTYDRGPLWTRAQFRPMGNVEQTYHWIQPLP